MNKCLLVLTSLILLFILTSCSGNQNLPVKPSETLPDGELPMIFDNTRTDGRALLGLWNIDFNTSAMTSSVLSERSAFYHYNAKNLIPAPVIEVNSYNPSTHIIDIGVTLDNNSSIDVYDVRLIIYTDAVGHLLLNPDSWTGLYDIPGGRIINPFKSYSTQASRRKFPSHTQDTKNLIILLPGENTSVRFAVDASVTGNCLEPFAMTDFTIDPLGSAIGMSAHTSVSVYDWQMDVDAVYLHCPRITGQALFPYSIQAHPIWEKTVYNMTGAPAGLYEGILIAESANSGNMAVYDIVEIPVKYFELTPNPHKIGEFWDSGFFHFYNIDINDNIAYLSLNQNDLYVIDISDVNNPCYMAHLNNCYAETIEYGDGYIFAHDNNDEIRIIDVLVPDYPVMLGKITEDNISGFAYDDFNVFMGARVFEDTLDYSFSVYDVNDHIRPTHVTSIPFPDSAENICISNNLAVVAAGNSGILILDVSDPANPVLTGQCSVGYAEYLDVQDNYAFAYVNDNNLNIVNLDDPANPESISEISISGCGQISVTSDYAFVAEGTYGLEVIDISNPYEPFSSTLIPPDHMNASVKASQGQDDIIFIAASYDGLTVVDISDISNPVKLSSLRRFTPYKSAAALYNVYVLENSSEGGCKSDNSLTIINTYDKENLLEMSSLPLEYPLDIALKNDFSYIADSTGGLKVIDISNERNPFITGSLSLPDATSVELSGSQAYILDSENHFVSVNISNPQNPSVSGYCDLPGAYDLLVYGNYAYVTCGTNGLKVVDISSPSNPVVLSSGSALPSYKIGRWKDYIYVSDSTSILSVFDIHDPSNIQLLSSKYLTNQNPIREIDINAGYAYVSQAEYHDDEWGDGEITIYKINSQPDNLQQVDTLYNQGGLFDTDIYANYMYVVQNRYYGLVVYELW
jgi:hypothetical protein